MIRVRVNGEERELEGEVDLRALVGALGWRPEGVAVAVNGEVVPRARLGDRKVRADDRIEVIRAVGGG